MILVEYLHEASVFSSNCDESDDDGGDDDMLDLQYQLCNLTLVLVTISQHYSLVVRKCHLHDRSI